MQLARGKNKIIYQATGFQTDVDVTALFWTPSMKKEGPYEFTELEEGLYFININIIEGGPYIGMFFENGVKIKSETFRANHIPGIIQKQTSIIVAGD